MKTLEIKPNYSELARIHECDRRTVKKYDEEYDEKPKHRSINSRLDKYKNEISDKLDLPGSTINELIENYNLKASQNEINTLEKKKKYKILLKIHIF